ncbi:hypothetical protein [Variovorax arabinosiphilus]|uniref:hypothetical protein n=1 Tax=Variovorax arabinosiphilus TaxID=3053498 RepID=UPI0025753C71|nr:MULTISPECIES: hypothetical protein [unclassified Variovorax]MDM0122544.1 hypothetical protein [Variovorax sp. J2L1-78]MDM0130927.1 hypothetical protein [Variovorax sp. J2L1-63]MDM0235307.1 hypothetical protein [Variovorax sp. J2R1-6]
MPHVSPLPVRVSRCLVLALLTSTLAACGGGDGGTTSPAPTTPTQPATPDTGVKPEMRCAP